MTITYFCFRNIHRKSQHQLKIHLKYEDVSLLLQIDTGFINEYTGFSIFFIADGYNRYTICLENNLQSHSRV